MLNRFTNSFSHETWHQKYKFKTDTTVEDTWRRVAKDLASIEKDKKEWEQNSMKHWKTLNLFPVDALHPMLAQD